jgi:hypothetical protein
MTRHLRKALGNKPLSRSDIYVDDLICFASGITTTWNEVDTNTYFQPGGTISTRAGITNDETLEIDRTVIGAKTIIHNILCRQAMKEDKVQNLLRWDCCYWMGFRLKILSFLSGSET